jgi:tRNA pseudouridine55 synthase
VGVGLLVVCVGKGTKSSDFFMAQRKVYSGVLKLGEATPSYDTETEVCQREPWEHLTDKMLQDAADKHFTGELQQVRTKRGPYQTSLSHML